MADGETLRSDLSRLLRLHSEAVGIDYLSPYGTEDDGGQQVEFCGYLPDFGGPNGMIVEALVPKDAGRDALLASLHRVTRRDRLYMSQVNPEPWVEREFFIEAIVDWGFYGAPARYHAGLAQLHVPNFAGRRAEIEGRIRPGARVEIVISDPSDLVSDHSAVALGSIEGFLPGDPITGRSLAIHLDRPLHWVRHRITRVNARPSRDGADWAGLLSGLPLECRFFVARDEGGEVTDAFEFNARLRML